jgi:hypothetical protein
MRRASCMAQASEELRIMKCLSFCLLLAAATSASAQSASDKPGDKIAPQSITLTGCVVAGVEPNTYMLSKVLRADTPVGTTGSADPDAFYWLTSAGRLKSHVGQQVRVIGVLDDDVSGTKVKEKDGKVEMTSGGKKVEVPEGTVAADAVKPDGLKRASYQVKVESVTKLSGRCPK